MPEFHHKSIERAYRELKTNENGLSQNEALRRIKKNGLNILIDEEDTNRLAIFYSQFKSPLILILVAAALVSFFLQELVNMGVILGAVLINTLIGYFQENKADQALKQLRKIIEHKALVIRGGSEFEIDASQVALGDLLDLQPGNRVPADARIIESNNLETNESSLTGESSSSEKTSEKMNKGASLADRRNMVYAGTIIVKGNGRAVVTAVGKNSEIGKVAQLVKHTEKEKTPLQFRLEKLSKFLSIFTILVCLLVVFFGILSGRDFFEMFIMGVALAVASIPEGLTVAVTVILVLGMQRILKKKALVRKLVAAETLGSTTVICADKTGTLTEGNMRVASIIIGNEEFKHDENLDIKTISLALKSALMCNDAFIENPKDNLAEWKIIGTPTEKALLSAAVQSGLNREEILETEEKVGEIPFTSESKYMAALYKKKDGSSVIYEKGAPEILIAKSEKFYSGNKIIDLAASEKKKLLKIHENLTDRGLRVVGIAIKTIHNLGSPIDDDVLNLIDNELTFIGFIALSDPLRPEAKEMIREAKLAGIRTIMITGDHAFTARAIAREAGLESRAENIITGEELEKIDDKELKHLVKKIDIYARVSPHHKLRIVKALQARGEVVAMTGDGINDSPALKSADIGISLGTGSDIAKETSDIVLLDNNFKTIVEAIFQGRIIFANIRKVIVYLLSDSFSEVILVAGSILLGFPLAIIPAQILWINIVNDGLPNFSLAFEKNDESVLRDKPIKKNEPIINGQMKYIIFGAGIARDVILFGFFYYLYKTSDDINFSRTFIFSALGVDSLLYIFSLRNLKKPIWKVNPFSNLYLVGAVGISFVLMLVAIYSPFMQKILSTVPLSISDWGLIASAGIMSVIMIEVIKYFSAGKKQLQFD